MNYQLILNEIGKEIAPLFGSGKVADYIPALAKISPRKFGVSVKLISGESYHYGDSEEAFSIQSISKLFSLTMALRKTDDQLWKRVGREPSGNAFNSLVQLEYEQGIPRNPFINAGALVITDYIYSRLTNAKTELINFMRMLSGNPKIDYNELVAKSEQETGHLNAALANFLKSFGNLENDVASVLDLYFHQCSIAMSCQDLASACLFLANGGREPNLGKVILNKSQTKKVNSILLTCGTYDAVGDFAYRVGMPGKSGVGGGIVAVIPQILSICVWSPELNEVGNSLAGTKALELFTTKTEISIF